MKRFLFALLHSTCGLKFISWLNRRKVTILCYHSVTGSEERVRHDPYKLQVPLYLFQKHLDYLQRNYNVISLADFLAARREQRPLPDYSVVLIFDDGYQDFFTVAADHLSRRKLPATVFVITDRMNGSLPVEGEAFLSWREVKELVATGIQVGSHTCSHRQLLDLPFDELRRELADARTAILSQTKQEEVPLSYPYGRASEDISKLAQSLGYCCGITGALGPNSTDTDIFLLNRTVIASDDDLATFAARVSGLTWWANRVRLLVDARNRKEWERGFSALQIDVSRDI
jgi:peptidoglycan/xylan/chitin deacetylase (PgdA/CDA1 family)